VIICGDSLPVSKGEYIQLPSGVLLQLVEIKGRDMDLHLRDVIMERLMLTVYKDEPAHHNVYHDNLPTYEAV